MLSNVFEVIKNNVKCIPVLGGNYSDVSVVAKSDFVRDAINNYESKVSPNLYATDLNSVGDDLIVVTGHVRDLTIEDVMRWSDLCREAAIVIYKESNKLYDDVKRLLCENLFCFDESGNQFHGVITKCNFREVVDNLFKHNLFTECVTNINLFFRLNNDINSSGYDKFRDSSGKSIRVVPLKPLTIDLSEAVDFILNDCYPETIVIHNTNKPGNCKELISFIDKVNCASGISLLYTGTDVDTNYSGFSIIKAILSHGYFDLSEVLYHIRPIYTKPETFDIRGLVLSNPCGVSTFKEISKNLDDILKLESIDKEDAQRCLNSFAIGQCDMVTDKLPCKFIPLFNLYCYESVRNSLRELPIGDGVLCDFLKYRIPAKILYSKIKCSTENKDWFSIVSFCYNVYLNMDNLREFSAGIEDIVREAVYVAYEEYCKENYIVDLSEI